MAKYNYSGNGANLVFEQTLWQATDKLQNNMDAAEYEHVVLCTNNVGQTLTSITTRIVSLLKHMSGVIGGGN